MGYGVLMALDEDCNNGIVDEKDPCMSQRCWGAEIVRNHVKEIL